MPGVDLPAAHHDLLGRDVGGSQLTDALRRRLRAEERDEVARGVGRNGAKRVAGDHTGELGARPDDHLDLESEPGLELSLELSGEALGRKAAREDDVAALEVRAHVLVAMAGEQLAQVCHADAPATGQVDPTK